MLPETVLSGYFLEGGSGGRAHRGGAAHGDRIALSRRRPERHPIDLVLGFYETLDGTLHNSAAYLSLRGDAPAALVHVHRKNFLPPTPSR